MPKLVLKLGERKRVDKGIYARGRADGKIGYEIRYWHKGREVWEYAGSTITQARTALAARKGEIVKGKFELPEKIHAPTFKAFTVEYLTWAEANKKSWTLDVHLLKPLLRAFGPLRLGSITVWKIEQYKARRVDEVSKRTVNMELSLLRRMFNLAMKWSKAKENPVLNVERLREDEKPIRTLTLLEEKRLLAASPQHLRDFITLALNTGLRLGELRALSRADVDLSAGVIRVSQSKTGRVRYVPINAASKDVLVRGLDTARQTVLGYGKEPIGEIHRTWYRATKAAGLQGLRIHDLRHTFATRLVLSGTDLPTVQRLLGHRTIQMTARYSHPGPDNLREAVERLD